MSESSHADSKATQVMYDVAEMGVDNHNSLIKSISPTLRLNNLYMITAF